MCIQNRDRASFSPVHRRTSLLLHNNPTGSIFEIKWHLGVGKPHDLPKMGPFALVKHHWQMEGLLYDSGISLRLVSPCLGQVSLETDAEGAAPPEAPSLCLIRQRNTLNPTSYQESRRGSTMLLEEGAALRAWRAVFLTRSSLTLLKMYAGATVSKAISITMGAEEQSMLLVRLAHSHTRQMGTLQAQQRDARLVPGDLLSVAQPRPWAGVPPPCPGEAAWPRVTAKPLEPVGIKTPNGKGEKPQKALPHLPTKAAYWCPTTAQ